MEKQDKSHFGTFEKMSIKVGEYIIVHISVLQQRIFFKYLIQLALYVVFESCTNVNNGVFNHHLHLDQWEKGISHIQAVGRKCVLLSISRSWTNIFFSNFLHKQYYVY